jgi:hypothetical protein
MPMTSNEEIRNWFAGKRNYNEGVVLLVKYDRNKNHHKAVTRRKLPVMLEYQLSKLTGLSYIPAQVKQAPKTATAKAPGKTTEQAERRLVVVDDRVRLEDLPDHLKPLYLQNRELYKQMRALHEKMKLVKTDGERAKLRVKLSEYDDVVAANWKTLDAWDGTTEIKTTVPEELPEKEKLKQIGAARKFLSINMKQVKSLEGLKRQQIIFKISERANILKQLGATISEAILLDLKELGINN